MAELEKLKKQIKQEASENPEKFFATEVLREKGFTRGKCANCGMHFWSSDEERKVCGEPECSGGYTFIGDSPIEDTYSYTEAWEKYRDFMTSRGYESIDRYPVVARWRDDVEFVGGSIYCFQPYVVSGEAEPPAEELIIPQPSLRFNDIDNVGITGRHYVLHNHIGQTCFKRENYDQNRYFRDMFEFAVEELGIPEEKLILHEDAWGGGGNLGACMEFFVDGLELWNQVYMFYKQTPEGYEELDLKVLDMGMGHERITWISHGTETSYECVMPETLEKMKERTGLEVNDNIWQDFLPHSSKLNVDEVDDIDQKWEEIADEIEVDVDRLKDEIKPTAALYSVAEHSRALLFALADGKLPSNTGGGHNLRVIYRRAQDFIEKYDWDLDMKEVAEWNARELNSMFPELLESIDEVKDILEVEEEKYRKAREKAERELGSLENQPSVEQMIELYESHGVSPEMMEEAGFEVPEDFYAMVASEDETVEQVEEEFDLEGVETTEKIYYSDEYRKEMKAEVKAVRDEWIVLDRTVFYPEGGGQEPDKGELVHGDNEYRVTDVQKQGEVILHKVPEHSLEKRDEVEGRINWERRFQLMQHHSTTHLVNGASVEILGNHINQAGAHKTVEKGRLDITHYEKLSREELDEIEEEVRENIWKDLKIKREKLRKAEAEQKYGFRIYQGGAPPGNKVRIIKIVDEEENKVVDVEACGGTHLDKTSEAEEFLITSSNKVQDGVIRLNYKAGEAAEQHINQIRTRIEKIADKLGVEKPENHREAQRKLCSIFSVEPEHLESTVENFLEDNDGLESKIVSLSRYLDEKQQVPRIESDTLVERAESLFDVRKQREKTLENLESEVEHKVRSEMEERFVEEEIPTENIGLLIQVARKLAKDQQASVTLVGKQGAVSASFHEDFDADKNLEKYGTNIQGDENFAKTFDLK
ncbi:MAG: alanyl-tRNA synthetase [Candidatus Nanohaloarchaea archaeon]|jgi:alanyl-tRNA synthetase